MTIYNFVMILVANNYRLLELRLTTCLSPYVCVLVDFYCFIEINNTYYFVPSPLLFNQVIFGLSGNKKDSEKIMSFH